MAKKIMPPIHTTSERIIRKRKMDMPDIIDASAARSQGIADCFGA
jgi:hypothetical protein